MTRMFPGLVLVLSLVACCESALVYSSFYAPLHDPRILGYRVDARFEEWSGQRAREQYGQLYGHRGQNLIEDLGNGRGPGRVQRDDTVYGDVKFYYTYPGAYTNQQ